jgi:hypothetical protein
MLLSSSLQQKEKDVDGIVVGIFFATEKIK